MQSIPFLDADEVHRRARWDRIIPAFAEAHRGEASVQSGHLRMVQEVAGGQPDVLILAPAWDAGKALGVKLVTSFPRNLLHHGQTTVGSIYVLFDPGTGKPAALLDGEALIFRKTAADTALGAQLLARPDARRLLMMGAGALAPWLIDAVCHVRPTIDEILIWNRSEDKAEALAASCRARGFAARPCTDPEAGQRQADIVIAATMAQSPIVFGDLLPAGAHVGLVGSFTPQMREGDDTLLRRAHIYVDDFSALEKSGEFTGPLERGIIRRTDILGNLHALCSDDWRHPGPKDVTLFKNGGASHLDLIVAGAVVER